MNLEKQVTSLKTNELSHTFSDLRVKLTKIRHRTATKDKAVHQLACDAQRDLDDLEKQIREQNH